MPLESRLGIGSIGRAGFTGRVACGYQVPGTAGLRLHYPVLRRCWFASYVTYTGIVALAFVHHLQFIRRYVRDPKVVGAVAPSSRALAVALSRHYKNSDKPATVLEVGAGTGPVTRYLGTILGDADSLDICEVQPSFVKILQHDVVSSQAFGPAVKAGRVNIIAKPVQQLTDENRYDFIISGLPFTAFDLSDVRDIFDVIRRVLKPGGVFSYFEYVGLRKISRNCSLGKKRSQIRGVSSFLNRLIREHQFDREMVVKNFPPAYARHLRFDS